MTAPAPHPSATPLSLAIRFAPGRPAIAAGLRAAVATVVPLLVTTALRSPHASWAMLAGFNVSLGDRGGSYATRARTLTVLTVADAAAVVLGAFAAGHLMASILLVLAWTMAGTMLRALGAAGTSIGMSSTVVLLISIATPAANAQDALARGAYVVAGGAWAMVLALALWPLRPYRPTRLAVSAVYLALAEYASELGETRRSRSAAARLPALRAGIRTRIENARALVGADRRGRGGETPRGERLLVLVELADQLFGLLIALTDAVESGQGPVGVGGLASFAATARRVAHEVTQETRTGRTVARRPGSGGHAADGGPPAPSAPPAPSPAPDAGVATTHPGVLWERLAHYAALAARTSDAIAHGTAIPSATGTAAEPVEQARTWDVLRATLAPGSLTLRHAARVSLVTAIATAAVGLAHVQRGYWITLTALIILQPTAGPTMLRALQRVIGTVLGAVMTAGLASVLHDIRGVVVLTFLLVAACVSVLPLNYTLYSMLLTPTFVLLAEVSAGDWHLASVRVVNTLLGGGIALAGAWLLWPSREGHLTARTTAQALRAVGDQLRATAELWATHDEDAERRLAQARGRAGRAALDAEASLERLLSEWPTRPVALEGAFARVVYLRRLIVSITALAATRLAPGAVADQASVAAFAEAATAELEELARLAAVPRAGQPRETADARGGVDGGVDAGSAGGAPGGPAAEGPPLPVRAAELALEASVPAVQAQLVRVAGQLQILASAFARG